MLNRVATGLDALLQRILPLTCLLCGAKGVDGRDLCAGCAFDLPRNLIACPRCAAPTNSAEICEHCRAHPPVFDRAFAPFLYQSPLDALIKDFKFRSRFAQGRLLGDLFAAALAERGGSLPDCIMPVPLHPRRLRERGFNQALELVRRAARQFQIPLLIHGLRRTRYTPPQAQLDARLRQTNLLGAFALGGLPLGSRVALMDDVITTTSTVAECAQILRSGGATDIEVWAIGRTCT